MHFFLVLVAKWPMMIVVWLLAFPFVLPKDTSRGRDAQLPSTRMCSVAGCAFGFLSDSLELFGFHNEERAAHF